MDIETERRNRIRASVFAYAYEFQNDSLISDGEFDQLCAKINPDVSTGHEVMDKFFKEQFDPSTGMWIRKHPELQGIERIYRKVFKGANA